MDLSFRHDLWWSLLPRSPRDRGVVRGLVLRPPGEPGRRRVVDELELDRERGVVGDKWSLEAEPLREAQVALINVQVLRRLARIAAPELTGDNLHVDLDLSEANLPPGTGLRIGDARLEVGRLPHRPCASLVERFGELAVKRIARANRRGLRGRGVLCSVSEPGRVRVGDAIVVERVASAVAPNG